MKQIKEVDDGLDDQKKSRFKKIVTVSIVFLVVFGLGFFGLADFLGVRTDYVIKIADKKVTPHYFASFLDNQKRQYISRFGSGIIEALLNKPDFTFMVINMMTDQLLIAKYLEDNGVVIDKNTVNSYITNGPTFKTPDGNFDKNFYHNYLSQMGISEESFIIDQIPQIQTMFFTLLIDSINFTEQRELVKNIISLKKQQRELLFKKIPINYINNTASDEEVKNYYEKQKEDFKIEERKQILIAKLDKNTIAEIPPSEAEILEEYNRKYFYAGQKLDLFSLTFSSLEEAKQVESLMKNKEASAIFDLVKKQFGYKESDIYLKNIQFEELSEEFKNQVVKLKPRDVSSVFFANDSYNIVRVENVSRSGIKNLNSVRGIITKNLKTKNSCSNVELAYNKIFGEVESGEKLEKALEGITKAKTMIVSSKINSELPANIQNAILEDTDTYYGKVLYSNQCEYYAYTIIDVVPATYAKIDDVREEILTKINLAKSQNIAFQKANIEYEKIKKDKSFDGFEKIIIKRDEKNFSNNTLNVLFSLKEGDVIHPIISEDRKFYYIFNLKKIINDKTITSEDEIEKVLSEIQKAQKEELLRIILDSLRKKYKVKVNYSMLNQINQQDTMHLH